MALPDFFEGYTPDEIEGLLRGINEETNQGNMEGQQAPESEPSETGKTLAVSDGEHIQLE
jgi:hypothetical protein